MAGSVNKVILIGNLGKDPEARSFQNGGKVVNFTLATSETWNDRSSGERKEKTEWHNIVIRNEKLAELAEKYLKKGSKVYLEGSIQSRKYEVSGQERYITEVIVGPFRGEMTFLSGRNDEGGGGYSGGGSDGGGSRAGGQSRDQQAPRGGSGGGGGGPSWDSPKGGNDLDDEIPF